MKKIVLVGYMGSGKTTIGKKLSKVLSMPFFDLDDVIETDQKKTIAEVFQQKGELYFRKKENEILTTLLSEKQSMVLATGGGTPCYGTVMQDLLASKDTYVIYLKLSVPELTNRLWQEASARPLIAHLDSKERLDDFIRKHLFERSYYYNQAHKVLSIDFKTPDEVVEAIIPELF